LTVVTNGKRNIGRTEENTTIGGKEIVRVAPMKMIGALYSRTGTIVVGGGGSSVGAR